MAATHYSAAAAAGSATPDRQGPDGQKPGCNLASARDTHQYEQSKCTDGAAFAVAQQSAATARVETTSPGKAAALQSVRDHHPGNAAATQERRLQAGLALGPVTTLEARQHLDVLHPAARVLSLRKRGIEVLTVWTRQATEAGRLHRIAKYVLISGAAGASA